MTPYKIRSCEELQRVINSVKITAPAAVTLTMSKRNGSRAADQLVTSKNFRHFRNRLEHPLLGSAAQAIEAWASSNGLKRLTIYRVTAHLFRNRCEKKGRSLWV